MRFCLKAAGRRAHSAMADGNSHLMERLIAARTAVQDLAGRYLQLRSPEGWQTQLRFPFIQVGSTGVYNITADRGVLGVEIRPIPREPLEQFFGEVEAVCEQLGLQIADLVIHPGVACPPDHPYLRQLIAAVAEVSGEQPALGRKLAATSARFAPNGQGVVWGQSGIGPHSIDERHYIPSILPYYRALDAFADRLPAAASADLGGNQ